MIDIKLNAGSLWIESYSKTEMSGNIGYNVCMYDVVMKSDTDNILYRVAGIIPNKDKTAYDVLSEYIDSDDCKDKIIFVNLYHLFPIDSLPPSVETSKEKINTLLKFCRVYFSPVIKGHAQHILVYSNDVGMEFVKELNELGLIQRYSIIEKDELLWLI